MEKIGIKALKEEIVELNYYEEEIYYNIKEEEKIVEKVKNNEFLKKMNKSKPKYSIDISELYREREKNISEKIKKFNNPNLSESEKRKMVLKEEYPPLYYVKKNLKIIIPHDLTTEKKIKSAAMNRKDNYFDFNVSKEYGKFVWRESIH